MCYASWLGVDDDPPPDETSADILIPSDADNHDATGIPFDELLPEMPIFSDLGNQGVDEISPELPLNSVICHPGLPKS